MITQKLNSNGEWIDPNAFEIVDQLQDGGHTCYLVGGCIRDHLAGVEAKDFDVATSALPQQIKKRVRRAFIIGKRFRLVLVYRGVIQYEVATFRRNATVEELKNEDCQADNLFGSPKEDAQRRDFTVNALFYDPSTNEVIDYVDGLSDIKKQYIRIIGDPAARLEEDPIRILRGIRLSHKLNFTIEPKLREQIVAKKEFLLSSAAPRRREDFVKILKLATSYNALIEAYDLGVLEICFPIITEALTEENIDSFRTYMYRYEEVEIDFKEPKNILCIFVFCFLKSISDESDFPLEALTDRIETAFKQELGIFKGELEYIRSCIGLIDSLKETDKFSRRGERRKIAFVKNDFFDLSLELAIWDQQLTGEEIVFWMKEKHKYIDLPQIKTQTPKRKPKSKNFNKNRKPKNSKQY
ncbi:MAG: poly(A) polymerase [Bdellovibrionales bacterium]